MSMVKDVAVLGAGIMGVSTALFLARRGVRVVLMDAADRPIDRASRWNEGKIHLGYLYAGDASLETARRVLPGGLAFKPLVESLVSASIDAVTTTHDDTFLVHRDSVADLDRTAAYFDAVTRLVADHPDRSSYLAPLTKPSIHRLTDVELDAVAASPTIVGGFRVPERSVSTTWLAERLTEALRSEPLIEVRTGTRVTGVSRNARGRLHVQTPTGADGPYDAVVNALWEGRLAVDASMGVPAPRTWSNRYRVSLFVRTSRALDVPSAVICTGPFGDVKNYNGRDFYLSWYPAGLIVDSSSLEPEAPPALDTAARERLASLVIAQLASRLTRVQEIGEHLESCRVEGGWVYAAGAGSLADPASTLHRRDQIGVVRDGHYLSIDTGKYSTAPWLAHQIAADLTS